MTFFVLLILPYVFGMSLLMMVLSSLKYVPYIVAIGLVIILLAWVLG
ncbi:MAG: hypothetical protein WAX89_00935 [Alphaproteobacteria bacterium]